MSTGLAVVIVFGMFFMTILIGLGMLVVIYKKVELKDAEKEAASGGTVNDS